MRSPGSQYLLPVVGRGGVPADATAAIVNVSAVDPAATGRLTVHPCAGSPPITSSLNVTAGVNGANEIIADLNDSGELCIYTSAATHLLADVVDYLLETRQPR